MRLSSDCPLQPSLASARPRHLERFWAIGQDLRRASTDRASEEVEGLRTLAFDDRGDGVIFLRSPGRSPLFLVNQWRSVGPMILDRPLVPRLVLAADGFPDDLTRDRRDLTTLISIAQNEWCHWLGCTDLDRLALRGHRQLVELFGGLGTEVYASEEPDGNLLPPTCDSCRTFRADVKTFGRQVLCGGCRQQVEPRDLLADAVAELRRTQDLAREMTGSDFF